MRVEHIRLSQRAKEQLIKLKRHTGVQHWNELCRWAFCFSLRDPSSPPAAPAADSSVEMSWKVFGGAHADVYWALLLQRCHTDGLSGTPQVLSDQFRRHLHRGIAFLAGEKIKSIPDLLQRALHGRESIANRNRPD
jgi:DNA sulfur modification protein DndE